jgi:outer membrane protein assembly factor BamD (BamD/ComL family)
MRKKFIDKFYELYKIGFDEYEHGDWEKAKKYLEMAQVRFIFKV